MHECSPRAARACPACSRQRLPLLCSPDARAQRVLAPQLRPCAKRAQRVLAPQLLAPPVPMCECSPRAARVLQPMCCEGALGAGGIAKTVCKTNRQRSAQDAQNSGPLVALTTPAPVQAKGNIQTATTATHPCACSPLPPRAPLQRRLSLTWGFSPRLKRMQSANPSFQRRSTAKGTCGASNTTRRGARCVGGMRGILTNVAERACSRQSVQPQLSRGLPNPARLLKASPMSVPRNARNDLALTAVRSTVAARVGGAGGACKAEVHKARLDVPGGDEAESG